MSKLHWSLLSSPAKGLTYCLDNSVELISFFTKYNQLFITFELVLWEKYISIYRHCIIKYNMTHTHIYMLLNISSLIFKIV